jgi:peptidoglycan/xylan/chitin deacetylase (PgdA/CDA1 family)
MSYDDGKTPDRRLVDIFNRYGIRATFHINAGYLDNNKLDRISASEVNELYKGHEISAHGYTHQSLGIAPREMVIAETIRDRALLEKLSGYPVRGMSYPNGLYTDETVDILKACGIEYCRVMETTGSFAMPEDFMRWKGTCRHRENLIELGKEFLALPYKNRPHLMYVWGHSNEFDKDNNWSLIENFCEIMSGKDDIWYATNIEIVDYMNALKQLRFSANLSMVYNPTALDLVISKDEKAVYIPAGKQISL